MFSALLITFRETLEAVVVIGALAATAVFRGSVAGSFLRTLFGYTSVPTLLELISYASFVAGILWVRRVTDSVLLKPVQ